MWAGTDCRRSARGWITSRAVGRADGIERILGRWKAYARDGHDGNLALKDLPPGHARHFRFSILRVFGPSASTTEVAAVEARHKRELKSREFGSTKN